MKPGVWAGQDLVAAGYAGWQGTLRIGQEQFDRISRRFSPSYLRQLKEPMWKLPDLWAKDHLQKEITAYETAGEGGILAALWNLSGRLESGITFDLRRIPVRQITIEICELWALNPYRLLSGGCAVMTAPNGARAVRLLQQEGIQAAVIGQVTEGIARRMYHGSETAGFLERPQPDEYEKVMMEVRR